MRGFSPRSLLEMLLCSEAFFECWKKEVDGVVEDELGEVQLKAERCFFSLSFTLSRAIIRTYIRNRFRVR